MSVYYCVIRQTVCTGRRQSFYRLKKSAFDSSNNKPQGRQTYSCIFPSKNLTGSETQRSETTPLRAASFSHPGVTTASPWCFCTLCKSAPSFSGLAQTHIRPRRNDCWFSVLLFDRPIIPCPGWFTMASA